MSATATGPIVPDRRGLPADFDLEAWETDTDRWLGDHSFHWLTWREILEAPLPHGTIGTCVISREDYERGPTEQAVWAEADLPPSRCAWKSGGQVAVRAYDEPLEAHHTDVQIRYHKSNAPLEAFVARIQTLADTYGEGRLLMGFDS
jgi:hypothetical protein